MKFLAVSLLLVIGSNAFADEGPKCLVKSVKSDLSYSSQVIALAEDAEGLEGSYFGATLLDGKLKITRSTSRSLDVQNAKTHEYLRAKSDVSTSAFKVGDTDVSLEFVQVSFTFEGTNYHISCE